ncbi:intracellular family [Leptolyngbya sp. Heron Island J]|uniref:DJ-1/PfpI family protein n=1 Tax=Leptolyngbya sp. Heron Island J TaxID=1385935 RepID=UPI0003B941F3|nr:DJ-1/PfpI family protein [Leptolyngbya sp. Heron Island J]ESA36641.1 intracellular family [Leptolyngbya sp. Heron Island J]
MAANSESTPKRVAILIENKFEDLEFQIPHTALQKAGATVTVLGSRMNEEYQSYRGTVLIKPDATATEVSADNFDALVIPGGSIRTNPNVVRLVTNAINQDKWIAAVGHGPQVLIEVDQLKNKQVTGCRAIRKDIENAGAIYLDKPTIVHDHLITARRPGDLPIFTTTLLKHLGLTIKGTDLPDTTESDHEWWELGKAWGGSSRRQIVQALNTAIIGERYTTEAFRQYLHRVTDADLHQLLQTSIDLKRRHVKQLEDRLHTAFQEQVSWQAVGSEAYAALQSWLQSTDEIAILRRVLGDLQTGVTDTYRLSNQLTDPLTVDIMDTIEQDLAQYEQHFADLYRKHAGEQVQPPIPTTVAAVR